MNLRNIALRVFKNTLEASTGYKALVVLPQHPTIYRTFGEYVPANVPLPYVTIEHYAGGLSHIAHTEDSKSLWKIAAHSMEDEALVEQIADEIYTALHNVWPVMGTVTGYKGYNPILLKHPYFDTVNRQGHVLLRSGGIYTLCLAETQG